MSSEKCSPDVDSILKSPSYRLAYQDADFIRRPDMRPLRLELELLKPEILLEEQGVDATIVVFGGTQLVEPATAQAKLEQTEAELEQEPDNPARIRAASRAKQRRVKAHFYDECREFARIASSLKDSTGNNRYCIVTGGGPGIMEAANRGAHDVGAKNVGLNITLPFEQIPNPYITPDLCFQFNYFAIRKMHFLLRAQALVCFPGGFGTLDELFTTLTLRQTQRMQEIPVILYGTDYWKRVLDFDFLADEGMIQDDHLELFTYADTPREAWKAIEDHHQHDSGDFLE
jgi:uncharacterized protein (TIGR00730 family)